MSDVSPDVSVRRLTATWLVLIGATITTTWVLAMNEIGTHLALVVTFLLVSWKVRLVMLEFMELREAPTIGRFAFELWAIALPLVVVIAAW